MSNYNTNSTINESDINAITYESTMTNHCMLEDSLGDSVELPTSNPVPVSPEYQFWCNIEDEIEKEVKRRVDKRLEEYYEQHKSAYVDTRF